MISNIDEYNENVLKFYDEYKKDCKTLRISTNKDCCMECEFCEMDEEVDNCHKHGLYHDWDMNPDYGFVNVLVCDDFRKRVL